MKLSKGMLMAALITGTLANASAYAAEAVEEFTLDPMVVTATKMETKSLDIPASIEVISREKIEKSGAGSAYDVLINSLGVVSHSQGVNGMSMGSMTSRMVIRGVEKGTLVLVNGVKLNQDGKYNLEDIPAESIEKIEIVRGGGSVLYGSEATGGVINIITRKNAPNSLKVEAGNYGKERYVANINADKFSAVVNYQNKGAVNEYAASTSKVYDYKKGSQKGVIWNYDINEALTFTHSYKKNEHNVLIKKPGAAAYSDGSKYYDTDNSFLLKYDRDGWKGHVSYGTQEKAYDKDIQPGANAYLYSWRKGHNSEVDINKSLDLGDGKLLVGANYQREDMDLYAFNKGPFDSTYKRNVYSLYASYDWNVSEKDDLVFNARETWARNITGTQHNLKKNTFVRSNNDNVSKFTPEIQYIRKLSDSSRAYAKYGTSFRLPELTKIYGSGSMVSKLNLKPEKGTHYEVGYKKDYDKANLRVSLFSLEIKDAIDLVSGNPIDGNCEYDNTTIRNSGVEVAAEIKHDEKWRTNFGLSYSNPQQRSEKTFGDNQWHKYLSKYQLNGAINYQNNKFASMISANFVGNRTANDAKKGHLKPQCFTDLHMTYSPEKQHKFFFHLNNLFDRKDLTNSGTPGGSSAYYYSLGRNFMAGYEFTF